MKNIGLLLIFIITVVHLSYTQKIDRATDAFQNAPYIFDAIVIGLKPVQDENGTYFISYKMRVTQKLKGDKKLKVNDTIEVISILPDDWHIISGRLGKEVSGTPLSLQNGIQSGINARTVFFMKADTFKGKKCYTPYSIKSDSRFSRFPVYREVKGKTYVEKSFEIHGFGKEFRTIELFNEYLQSMGMPPLGEQNLKKKDVTFLEKSKKLSEEEFAQKVKNVKEYDKFLKNNNLNTKENLSLRSNESIFFEIKNETVTGTTTKYYEFDIMVHGNTANTFLDHVAFVIYYNSMPFGGGNIVANNKITITKGTNFDNTSYYNPMDYVVDNAMNSIRFGLGIDHSVSTWNRTQITTTPQQLLHVKIEIASCFGVTDVTFSDISNVSVLNKYTTISNIDPALGTATSYLLCPSPEIHSFSPAVISAGTNSILTIYGNHFGNSRGNGQVIYNI